MKQRYEQLQQETWGMPDGRQKLALMEEAIRLADQYLTEDEAYEARMDYSSAAMECGCPERQLVSFAWCLAKFEQKPGDYSAYSLMWHYKWVLNQIWQYPQLSLEVIESVFDDFKEKCVRYGYSLRPYYQQKVYWLLSQGNKEEAARYYKEWRGAPRDGLADCQACEQNLFGEYYFSINANKRGMQAVRPILEGKMHCHVIPDHTYSAVISPLLKLGEYDRAMAIANKAVRELAGPEVLVEYGVFLEFYAITDIRRAVKLYEKTIDLGLASRNPWNKLNYLLSVRFFLREWQRTKRRKKLREADTVTLPWLDQEIAALTEAFNKRNGTRYVDEYVQDKEQTVTRLTQAFRARE